MTVLLILVIGCVVPYLAYCVMAAFVVVKHPASFEHMGKLHPNRFVRDWRRRRL